MVLFLSTQKGQTRTRRTKPRPRPSPSSSAPSSSRRGLRSCSTGQLLFRQSAEAETLERELIVFHGRFAAGCRFSAGFVLPLTEDDHLVGDNLSAVMLLAFRIFPLAALQPAVHVHRLALRSEEHTSELQSQFHLACRLLL